MSDINAEDIQRIADLGKKLSGRAIEYGNKISTAAIDGVTEAVAEALTQHPIYENNHNLLDGTEQFMRLARQLDEPEFTEHHNVGIRRLRRLLLAEEYTEYCDAEFADDLVETVDGLLDIIVIAWGTLLAYIGPDKAKSAAAEVVRSNLSKVDGSLGPVQFREDGKVIKPDGWIPPDIEGVIS